MDSSIENKTAAKVTPSASTTSSSSNQLYIAESLDLVLPEDTFRMNLDNFSDIGENVTIGERGSSIDTINLGTPMVEKPAPGFITPVREPSQIDTPKISEDKSLDVKKSLLKLSLAKNDDIFVKPSPVPDILSPARMLQYELGSKTPHTPTMKRAAIDFDFFNKNKFEKFFEDSVENNPDVEATEISGTNDNGDSCHQETPIIVNRETVRHEIGYGK